MSLCCLMVYDFKHGWGRYEDAEWGEPRELYSDSDLRFGISYAEGMLEEGHTHEPFHKYDLRAFIEWAKKKLEESDGTGAETGDV